MKIYKRCVRNVILVKATDNRFAPRTCPIFFSSDGDLLAPFALPPSTEMNPSHTSFRPQLVLLLDGVLTALRQMADPGLDWRCQKCLDDVMVE